METLTPTPTPTPTSPQVDPRPAPDSPRAAPSPSRTLLYEDDEMRIWRIEVAPGSVLAAAETPEDTFVCVLQGSRTLVAPRGATAYEIRYERGQAAFVRAEDDQRRSYLNRGDEPLRLLRVEMKQPS